MYLRLGRDVLGTYNLLQSQHFWKSYENLVDMKALFLSLLCFMLSSKYND